MLSTRAIPKSFRPQATTSIRANNIRRFTAGSGSLSAGALRFPQGQQPSKPGPSKPATPSNPPRQGDNNPGNVGRNPGHGGFPTITVTQPSKPTGPKLDGSKKVEKVPVTPGKPGGKK